eukprot:TRINITY_DN5470_c0_g1_i1.p1 TRINITY_DN5470_c0_g1~~TRINITY_DN5470_c0_g1_i1.p1  ORF type:complete len:488 (-),score=76.38 TRINITY_DN5470_c0_g1_i1:35-1498(-)
MKKKEEEQKKIEEDINKDIFVGKANKNLTTKKILLKKSNVKENFEEGKDLKNLITVLGIDISQIEIIFYARRIFSGQSHDYLYIQRSTSNPIKTNLQEFQAFKMNDYEMNDMIKYLSKDNKIITYNLLIDKKLEESSHQKFIYKNEKINYEDGKMIDMSELIKDDYNFSLYHSEFKSHYVSQKVQKEKYLTLYNEFTYESRYIAWNEKKMLQLKLYREKDSEGNYLMTEKDKIGTNQLEIRIAHWNVNHMKYDESTRHLLLSQFWEFVLDNDWDIFALTEPKSDLNDIMGEIARSASYKMITLKINKSKTPLKGFTQRSNDTQIVDKEDVLVFYKSNKFAIETTNLGLETYGITDNLKFELIESNNKKINLSFCHLSAKDKDFTEKDFGNVSQLISEKLNAPYLLMGDFNNNCSHKIIHNKVEFGKYPWKGFSISKGTMNYPFREVINDQIYSSNFENQNVMTSVLTSMIPLTSISDHKPIQAFVYL